MPTTDRRHRLWLYEDAVSVQVHTFSGKTYVLESKDSLADADWSVLQTITGDGTRKSLTDTNATVPHRYYRVRQP